jgi:hypothetical protein
LPAAADQPASREELALALEELSMAYAEVAGRAASLEDELKALLLRRPGVDEEKEESPPTEEQAEAKHRQWYAGTVERVRATVRAHEPGRV